MSGSRRGRGGSSPPFVGSLFAPTVDDAAADSRSGDSPLRAASGMGEGAGNTPLAERMRPRSLEDVVGQLPVVGARGFLRQAIAADRVPSLIFWGPPGVGKTTLARLISTVTRAHFVPFSAVTSGIKEIKEVMVEAARLRQATGRRTLLFVDEIHRFNRAQQDAFLPYIERGDIVLVGATTENPSFELNSALLSRCRVVVLAPLSPEELVELQRRALADRERGLGALEVAVEDEALAEIAQLASGDARRALNLLEAVVEDARREAAEQAPREDPAALAVQAGPAAADDAAQSTPADGFPSAGRVARAAATPVVVDLARLRAVAQRKVLRYDKSGEEHFNLISALHKSLRESDPDAALYWLARMLAAGEDPHYLARRLTRFAVEDVGLADPGAVEQAVAGWQTFDRLGSPEGDLALAQVTVYLALAPKSVAVYKAWGAARRTVEERPADPVPPVIRNAVTSLMREVGYGQGYVYAPDTESGLAGLDCLPEALAGKRFYVPGGAGRERELAARLDELQVRRAAARESAAKKQRRE